MFKSKYLGVIAGAMMLITATPAQAAVLSQTQINAVISLLQSFGADQTTIAKVSTILGSTLASENGTCVILARDLTLGSTGVDVARLQNYLITKGYLAAGNNTGYYGYLTFGAVGQLQAGLGLLAAGNSNNVSRGIMGQKTRAAITCGSVTPGNGTLSASPTSGTAPLTVTFTLSGIRWSDAVPPPVTLNFGDNTSGTMTASDACTSGGLDCVLTYSATHSYQSAGTYRPSATLSGQIYTTVVMVTGTQSGTLSASPTSGTAPLTVTFTGTGNNATYFGGVHIDYGDGTTALFCNPGEACGQKIISHTYAGSGNYTASIQGVGEGTTNTVLGTTVISVAGNTSNPTCTMSASPTSVLVGQPYTITWSSQNASTMHVTGVDLDSTNLNGSFTETVGGIGGAPTATENYSGTVTDSSGHTASCSTSVTVSQNSTNLPNPLVSLRGIVTLNGTSQYVALPQLPDATAFTVSAWIRYTGSSCGVILSDGDTAPSNDMALGTDGSNLYVLADKSGTALAGNGCGYDLVKVPLSTSIAGAWHHIAWRNSGSASTLYVDGRVVGTVNLSGSNVGYHNSAAQVGRIDDGGTWYKASPQLFRGSIMNLRYYTTVLTAAQIAQIYTAGQDSSSAAITPSTI